MHGFSVQIRLITSLEQWGRTYRLQRVSFVDLCNRKYCPTLKGRAMGDKRLSWRRMGGGGSAGNFDNDASGAFSDWRTCQGRVQLQNWQRRRVEGCILRRGFKVGI